MRFADLPVPHVTPGMRSGRCPFDGYTRSLALTRDAGYARDRFIVEDKDFRNAYMLARDAKSPVLDENLANLFFLVKFYLPRLCRDQRFSVVEYGVANGGSLLFLASLARSCLPQASVIGIDTFASFPEGGIDPGVDWHSSDDFAHAADGIDGLAEMCDALGNVTLQKRRFNDGYFHGFPPIALCHIDADTREGVEAAFRESVPYMMPGGYWVFDDPLHSTCLGAMEAIEDVVIREHGLNCEQASPQFVFRAR